MTNIAGKGSVMVDEKVLRRKNIIKNRAVNKTLPDIMSFFILFNQPISQKHVINKHNPVRENNAGNNPG